MLLKRIEPSEKVDGKKPNVENPNLIQVATLKQILFLSKGSLRFVTGCLSQIENSRGKRERAQNVIAGTGGTQEQKNTWNKKIFRCGTEVWLGDSPFG